MLAGGASRQHLALRLEHDAIDRALHEPIAQPKLPCLCDDVPAVDECLELTLEIVRVDLHRDACDDHWLSKDRLDHTRDLQD